MPPEEPAGWGVGTAGQRARRAAGVAWNRAGKSVVVGAVSEQNRTFDEHDHDLYNRALVLMELRRPIDAAQLAAPLEHRDGVPEPVLELLGRAYFNSAQLGNAERVLRRLIDRSPANGWAHRVLARTLARRSADAEAARYHRIADGFGVA